MSKRKRDHIDDFNDYCDLWDQACQKGIFDEESPSEKPPLDLGDGLAAKMAETDPYYDYMFSQEDELLQEEETPNPIHPDSVGKDQDQPKASWVEMGAFEKLDNLKKKLYKIECQLGEQDAGGKKWDLKTKKGPGGSKLSSQLESLKKQIDTLSDGMGIEDEPKGSMWRVRK